MRINEINPREVAVSKMNRVRTLALGLLSLLVAACDSNVDVVTAASSGGESGSSSAGSGGSSGSGNGGGGSSGAGGAPSVCPPGKDPNCNAYPGMTAPAGTCHADGTCTCNDGFNLTNEGTCLNIDLCTYGFAWSCNGNDTAQVDMGTCHPDGTCTCNPGFVLDDTDRCVSEVCHGGCPAEGDTRCAGVYLQTCDGPGNGCAHHWITTDHCAPTWVCNSDATQCVPPSGACADDADCGCQCACVSGACQCSGSIPPSCKVNADCGPECAGLVCVAGACEKASSHP